MLPIASNIAVSVAREHVQSALPNAPVRPEEPKAQPRVRTVKERPQRMLVTALRQLATTSGGLADRLDRPVGAE